MRTRPTTILCLVLVLLAAILLAGCNDTAAPAPTEAVIVEEVTTATPVPPADTPTPVPPTAVPTEPSATATSEPPTATPEPPTATPVPPTTTPEPPTATPKPPTATPEPEPSVPQAVPKSNMNMRGGPGTGYAVVGSATAEIASDGYVSLSGGRLAVDTTLTKVANPAACGTGWYIDPANPANAKLCPATCTAIQADKGAKVQAVVPCQTTFTPITYTETYESTCPAGTKTQWGYFTYDSTTLSDSNVVFSVRSADTEVGLGSATQHLVATAHATPTDTQVCDASTACQVDLFNELGGLPDARRDWLEVTMELNPSMDGTIAPAVNDWQITFSCPDAE